VVSQKRNKTRRGVGGGDGRQEKGMKTAPVDVCQNSLIYYKISFPKFLHASEKRDPGQDNILEYHFVEYLNVSLTAIM